MTKKYICVCCKERFSEEMSPRITFLGFQEGRRFIVGPFCPYCGGAMTTVGEGAGGLTKELFEDVLGRVCEFHERRRI